jgi:hypothetical protein
MDKGAEYYSLFLSGSNKGIEQIILEYRAGLQMFLYAQTGDMTFYVDFCGSQSRTGTHDLPMDRS